MVKLSILLVLVMLSALLRLLISIGIVNVVQLEHGYFPEGPNEGFNKIHCANY